MGYSIYCIEDRTSYPDSLVARVYRCENCIDPDLFQNVTMYLEYQLDWRVFVDYDVISHIPFARDYPQIPNNPFVLAKLNREGAS